MPTRPTLRTRVSCRRGGCPGASLRLRVAARVRRTNPRGPDQPSLAQPWGSQPYSRSAVRRRNCAACGSAPCRFRKPPRTLPGPLNGGPGNRHPVPPWEPRPCEECCGAGGAGVQGADGAAMASIHGPESVGGAATSPPAQKPRSLLAPPRSVVWSGRPESTFGRVDFGATGTPLVQLPYQDMVHDTGPTAFFGFDLCQSRGL